MMLFPIRNKIKQMKINLLPILLLLLTMHGCDCNHAKKDKVSNTKDSNDFSAILKNDSIIVYNYEESRLGLQDFYFSSLNEVIKTSQKYFDFKDSILYNDNFDTSNISNLRLKAYQ